MAKIAISDLRPAGADLFDDSESYLHDLTDTALNNTKGGASVTIAVLSTFICGVTVGITISLKFCKAV